MSSKANARAALLLLTALNFQNYIDRNVLFAVQPLIQKEFPLDEGLHRKQHVTIDVIEKVQCRQQQQRGPCVGFGGHGWA